MFQLCFGSSLCQHLLLSAVWICSVSNASYFIKLTNRWVKGSMGFSCSWINHRRKGKLPNLMLLLKLILPDFSCSRSFSCGASEVFSFRTHFWNYCLAFLSSLIHNWHQGKWKNVFTWLVYTRYAISKSMNIHLFHICFWALKVLCMLRAYMEPSLCVTTENVWSLRLQVLLGLFHLLHSQKHGTAINDTSLINYAPPGKA